MSQTYYEYRYRFPVTGIATALAVIDVLRVQNLLGDRSPRNMLGDTLDQSGDVTDEESSAFRGRRSGDHIYLHVRAAVDPAELWIDLSAYGLEPVDEAASAAILGVWA